MFQSTVVLSLGGIIVASIQNSNVSVCVASSANLSSLSSVIEILMANCNQMFLVINLTNNRHEIYLNPSSYFTLDVRTYIIHTYVQGMFGIRDSTMLRHVVFVKQNRISRESKNHLLFISLENPPKIL